MADARDAAPLWAADGLFARLRRACADDWERYAAHEFVRRLGVGALSEAAFRRYLVQDYLFLIHFARAYGLAVFKSETLPEMRDAAAGLKAILDVEMRLHVTYCAGWGLSEGDLAAAPEASQTMAYTRFVLERGLAGDVLDLWVALAPCMLGYAEIAERLSRDSRTKRAGNPYADWIAMYAGAEYRAVARAAAEQLDRLWTSRAGRARFDSLLATFRRATQLEADFWQMGLDADRVQEKA